MPTTNKGLEQPANGSNVNTWDVPVNGNFGIIDEALGGISTLSQITGTHTLAIGVYRTLILQSTVNLSGNVRYNIPSGVGGQWIVRNATSGNFTFTIGTTAVGSFTTVVIPQGQAELIYSDGSNIRLARTTGERFPVGAIVMWSGAIGDIPTGWLLCNGQPGTPDLRDKFIVGAGSSYAVAAMGGSKDAIVVSHTHTATVTDPGHGHEFLYSTATQSSANQRPQGGFVLNEAPTLTTQSANTGAASTTNQIGEGTTGVTVTNSTQGGDGTNANLPPYYALAYIIRTAY